MVRPIKVAHIGRNALSQNAHCSDPTAAIPSPRPQTDPLRSAHTARGGASQSKSPTVADRTHETKITRTAHCDQRAPIARSEASPANTDTRSNPTPIRRFHTWSVVWSAHHVRRTEVSSGCAGDEGRDDVGSVPVEGLAAAVVAHRRARVGATGRLLHVTQRDAGVRCGGDEGVSQGVWSDSLADLGSAGNPPHDPPSGVAVQTGTLGVERREGRAAS